MSSRLTWAGDDVIVQAIENATFKADMNVEVTSSGGGLLEKGSSTAVGITISTNQMDTEAVAYINDSTVVAGNSDTTGDHNGVAVLAENTRDGCRPIQRDPFER